MKEKVYRCGYCGTPTDKGGHPLTLDGCKKLTEAELKDAELVEGWCCYEEQHDNYIIVTRDMASDAGDMSLEGQRWKW